MMTPDELIELLRAESSQVLPFVGSGMTIAAGAPRTPELARELAKRCGLILPADTGLADVTAAAEAALGVDVVRERLAEMVTGWRLRPTPALVALAATPAGRVYTTNYDDGLERAAQSRGIEAVTLLPEDVETMQNPGDRELQVIHLHGVPGKPQSLVLPGRGMQELAASEVFQRFVSPRMASSNLLYLGFSFDAAEHHLLGILSWISEHIERRWEHYLLLSEAAIAARPADMARFSALGFVAVVGYPPDPTHEMVERVALALAPRAARTTGETGETPSLREIPTTLQPILIEAAPGDDLESLQQKVFGFDNGLSGAEAITTAEAMVERKRSLLVGGPGMGKTTLVALLDELTSRPHARGELKAFGPTAAGPSEEAIARLLKVGDAPLARENLEAQEGVIALDGLDEIEEELRTKAVEAILAAAKRWPQQHWLVTSRPCAELTALKEAGFGSFHIMPSRRWARQYLEMRSVPQARVQRAMLDGYGLGDLLSIPQFAARLADRLLDETAVEVSPLDLLVSEQYAASTREAIRDGKQQADLGAWMRSLAVALELSGRASSDASELARVPGPAGLGGEEARERLVKVSLLADIPDVVAFPLKTLQEGLCADAILKAPDPVAALRHFASAQVAGVEYLRDDIEMTIDLVFEHAGGDARAQLRELDEARWARTVLTVGTEADAREALDFLQSLHARRGLAYPLFADGALRGSRAAVAGIARRWPAVVEERRVRLEEELRSGTVAERMRALQTLGRLDYGPTTEDWLLPALADPDPQVLAQAAEIAGRLCVRAAEPALRGLLDSRVDRVRRQVLAALVEIVDLDGLVEVGASAGMGNALQPVAERLLERLDLDHGIALVARTGSVDGIARWLLTRLIETAHEDAWNAERVRSLMGACERLAGLGPPDPQVLADIFARHPEEALDTVRVQRVGEGPWAPLGQLIPIGLLDPALLDRDGREDLGAAMTRADQEREQLEERTLGHERDLASFLQVLNEKGASVEPDELTLPLTSLYALTPEQRETVSALVERWWPEGGLAPVPAEEGLDARTRAMLSLGTSSRPEIGAGRWTELLDAHLAARRFGEHELGEGVVAWLGSTYTEELQEVLIERLGRAGDGRAVSAMLAIGRGSDPDGAILDAALERLVELGPDTLFWGNAVGLLAEARAGARLRSLLTPEAPSEARHRVTGALARHGDGEAQIETVRELTKRVMAGEKPERPHWQSTDPHPELVSAAADLADAALSAEAEELAGFALSVIQAQPSEEALATLAEVINSHRAARPWMDLGTEQMARRIATRAVLDRLPSGLADVVMEFESATGSA